MRSKRAPFRLAGTVCCALVLAGCTSDGTIEGDPPTPTAVATEAQAAATEAGRLRLRLEQQFGVLLHRGLEAPRARKADREAAQGAVDEAIASLTATVAAAYDREAADDLEGDLVSWAERLADHAGAGDSERADSREALLSAGADIAAFMAEVTDDTMEAEGTAALLREPMRAAATAAEAYADGDFDRTYLHHRAAFADMISVGQGFSAGITEQFPDRYPGPRSSGPVELQAALQQLLTEHALLTATVTRRGARGARDFDAAAAALNGNTEDLVTALEAVYGSATSAFTGAWRDRISLLADYTVAAAEDRAKRRTRVAGELRRADSRIGAVIEDLTEGTFPAGDATAAMERLTAQLRDHVDGYVNGKRAASEQAVARAVAAGADLVADLAEAIVAHRPNDFSSQ